MTYTSPGRSEWSVRMERDAGGLEVARWMPGGVEASWRHDEGGRPTERRIVMGGGTVARRTWRWRPEGQLAAMTDTAHGGLTEYLHDARGRLVGERRPDGSLQHRAMDVLGNLFRQPGREDRRYGPGGRLLEAEGIHYNYDADGNLTEKRTSQGTWRYGWNGAGLLREVQRPDGACVRFGYDALARRTLKVLSRQEARESTPEHEVHFVWDGHVPLHEVAASESVTTWLFEPESFSPLAQEDSTGRYAVVTDHLGAPTEMYDELGRLAWRMQLDSFGVGRVDVSLQQCPWRWPGQYEDTETGLLYNRFRYYDAYAGRYISQDPLRLAAGSSLYGYPEDPFSATDPLGLVSSGAAGCGKLPRYEGPKPRYTVNPAHVPGQRGFNPKKTPLPNDAEDVFKRAVPGDPVNPRAWFGKNSEGKIYRYSLGNDGTAHFSGIRGVGDGVRNLTKYAEDRLEGL